VEKFFDINLGDKNKEQIKTEEFNERIFNKYNNILKA